MALKLDCDGSYTSFLAAKRLVVPPAGFACGPLPPSLFAFQADAVRWALERGRAALFFDCGLGKTAMQVTWAAEVARYNRATTKGELLICEECQAAKRRASEAARSRRSYAARKAVGA